MQLVSIIIDDEPHATAEITELIEITPDIIAIQDFEDVGSAVAFLKENGKVDVIFCDINMPLVNGLQAASLLAAYCDFIVYVTAHRFHGPETYEVNAAGYLMKPLKYDKFLRQVKELIKIKETSMWSNDGSKTLFVKGSEKNSMFSINSDDIIFIHGLDNYIKFHTTEGERTTYMQLKDLETTLMKKDGYIRVAKSIIISMKFLLKVDGYRAYMKTGEVFSIGKVYRPAFNDFLLRRRIN